MYLIVGLGNPGKQYEKSRHNIGFVIADKANLEFQMPNFKSNPKTKCQMSKGRINSKTIIIAKPQTFMNESGQAVRALTNFYKIKPENIIVIHDDLDLPLGEFKIQKNRGAAGHNGAQSVIDQLGTQDFIRLRVGIASPGAKKTGADFVLGKFSKTETEKLKKTINLAVEAIRMIVVEGAEKAMTQFN
jgi:PTH1 family peptidyl-tRNA hydrolase